MSEALGFDSENILGDGLGSLTRGELLDLARGLCRALMDAEGECHGNVHRGNVSRTSEGDIGLGPAAGTDSADWTSDRLEFMAPELFWNRKGDATADVYSVGLILFAGLSGGRLPFNPADGDLTSEDRAAALRRRMSGDAYALPADSGEKLGEVLQKCLAFRPNDRYSGAVELLAALSDCPETEAPSALPLAVAAEAKAEPAAVAAEPEYKVDKQFEERIPPKPKKNKKPFIIVGCICAALILLALAIKLISAGGEKAPSPPPSTPDAITGLQTPTPAPQTSATPSATPAPTATPSPTPAPTPSPTPTPAASTYELYIEDVSWTEAAEKCTALGGHLVTISDAEELKKITDLADAYKIKLVWIGLYRDVNGNLIWVTDESIDYYIWGKGEPSKTDGDGAAEDYGLLWKLKGSWIYNDSREDPANLFPAAYSGKIAYICEYDA
ncbi:MAG: lectin-like protein [Oscillospiraceae bacterium]